MLSPPLEKPVQKNVELDFITKKEIGILSKF